MMTFIKKCQWRKKGDDYRHVLGSKDLKPDCRSGCDGKK